MKIKEYIKFLIIILLLFITNKIFINKSNSNDIHKVNTDKSSLQNLKEYENNIHRGNSDTSDIRKLKEDNSGIHQLREDNSDIHKLKYNNK